MAKKLPRGSLPGWEDCWSIRTKGLLAEIDVSDFEKLCRKTKGELMSSPGYSKTIMWELERRLSERGLGFRCNGEE